MGGPERLSRYDCINIILNILGRKIKSQIKIKKTSLKEIDTFDKRPLNVSMNINKLKKVINFKLKKINIVAKNVIAKNNVKNKILKRR